MFSRRAAREAQEADFSAIDRAIREVEKQTKGLNDIERMTTTILGNAEKILRKCGVMREFFSAG